MTPIPLAAWPRMSASAPGFDSVYTSLTAIGGHTDGPTWATIPAAAPGTSAGLEAPSDRLRDPERPDTKPVTCLTCHPASTSTRAVSTPLRGPKIPLTAAKPPRLAPPNRHFRGLLSLKRRSHGPADVMLPVWRCHCGPERTLSESVHWLRPVEGRFTPVSATNSRLWPLSYGTQTPVHPQYCVEGTEKKRAYSTPHPCAEPWGDCL